MIKTKNQFQPDTGHSLSLATYQGTRIVNFVIFFRFQLELSCRIIQSLLLIVGRLLKSFNISFFARLSLSRAPTQNIKKKIFRSDQTLNLFFSFLIFHITSHREASNIGFDNQKRPGTFTKRRRSDFDRHKRERIN